MMASGSELGVGPSWSTVRSNPITGLVNFSIISHILFLGHQSHAQMRCDNHSVCRVFSRRSLLASALNMRVW